jgi:coenzyme F420-reducing hydrogenase beta subunit
MLQTVNKTEAGPAIAFDANEHAPERATMSLASAGSDDLWMVLETREKGGRHPVEKAVKAGEAAGGIGDRKSFQWIARTKRHNSGAADSRKDSLPGQRRRCQIGLTQAA